MGGEDKDVSIGSSTDNETIVTRGAEVGDGSTVVVMDTESPVRAEG